MKETKVYMELPNGANEETCDECPYAELGEVQHYFINNEIVSCRDCVCKLDKSCGFRHGEKNCPLIDIKTHDRELVKEVCEKIRKFCENNKYRCNKYFLLYSIGLNVKLLNKNKEGQKETFYEFLDQLQKEYEK